MVGEGVGVLEFKSMRFVARPWLILMLLALPIGFQNCSQLNLSGSKSKDEAPKADGGYPYDGKLYAEFAFEKCADGTNIRTRVAVYAADRASVLRENCQDLSAPRPLASGSFHIASSTATTMTLGPLVLHAEVAPAAFTWFVLEQPPAQSNPLVIVLPDDKALSSYGCGLVYAFNSSDFNGREVRLVQNPTAGPLRHPVQINTGNYSSLHVRGLHFEIAAQPGCPNAASPEHFEIPGHKALDIGFTGATAFIEGVFIDMKGADADCIVANYQNSGNAANAKIVVQNSTCWGSRGNGGPSQIAGGLLQVQTLQGPGTLIFENVSTHAGCQGIVLSGYTTNVTLRNYDFQFDARYAKEATCSGPAFIATTTGNVITAQNVTYSNAFTDPDYGFYLDEVRRYGSQIPMLPGMFYSRPATGDFAPKDKTGLNYQSPH